MLVGKKKALLRGIRLVTGDLRYWFNGNTEILQQVSRKHQSIQNSTDINLFLG